MMNLLPPYNVRLVLFGVGLLGASAGLIGTFAVLRRRALTGDALAHASLPGLCLAFLIVGRRNTPAMLAGALAAGLLGVLTIAALRRWTRIKEDAAIGIVLSVFFGAGIVLKQRLQSERGNKAGLDSYIFGATAAMQSEDLRWIIFLSLVTLVAVLLLYKEFKMIAFDADYARAQGWPVYCLDLILMGLIALAVVIGLPAVGVLLTAALLIVPAATARFWTHRLGWMLFLSALIGILSGVAGTWVSAVAPKAPAGPAIILAAVAFFILSALLSPWRGLLGFSTRKSAHESMPGNHFRKYLKT